MSRQPTRLVALASIALGGLTHSAWAAEATPAATPALATPVLTAAVQPDAAQAAAEAGVALPPRKAKRAKKAKADLAKATPAADKPASDRSPGAGFPANLALKSAQQQELPLPAPIDRIAVADPGVADALVLKPRSAAGHGALLVTGKRTGTTTLLVWFRGQARAATLTLVVDGDALNGTGLQANGAVLTGAAPDMLAQAQASELARQNLATTAGKTVIDQSTVALSGTVQVDVKVVEFSKTALKQIGINFSKFTDGTFKFGTLSPSAGSQVGFSPTALSGGAVSPSAVTVQPLLPIAQAFNLISSQSGNLFNLSLLQSNGMARVLAEPTLLAQSGQSASFLAGGEIPIPVPQGLGSVAIQYKPFGVGLDLTPTVISANRISLKVAPQASELDYNNALTISGFSVPAIRTRRTDTTVELGDGESFVIGGLISKSTISNVDKVPLLGDLPIIGAFFKNLNFRSEEKELLIIVTPHLVRPMAKGANLGTLPGAAATGTEAPVWTPYLLGGSGNSFPGLSQ